MPQVKRGSRGAGLHMPGVYAALLASERAKYERRGEPAEFDGRQHRVTWKDRDDHDQGFFLWPRHLLDRLEAGDPVQVDRARVELALWERDRPPRPVRLPFDREVRSVRVSPEDRLVPAAAEEADAST